MKRRSLLRLGVLGGAMVLPPAVRAAEPGVSDVQLPRLKDVRRLIIDTDPGNDDAVAILMALSAPAIKVEAITIAPGNIRYEQEVRNALYVVELAGQGGKVPVHPGARHPLLDRPYPHATFIHGRDGLGGVEVPDVSQKPDPEHAADAIRRIVRAHPGEVAIAALGSLTNVALALLREPEIAPLIKGIVFVGGTTTSAVPMFNPMVDPEAVDIVLRSGTPITMFGGMFRGDAQDPSVLVEADYDRIARLSTARSCFFMTSNAQRLAYEVKARGARGSVNADPFAMSLIIDPSIGTAFKSVAMKVELEGTLTRGTMLYGDNRYNGQPTPPPNVDLCVAGSNEGFKRLLLDTLSKA